MTLGKLALTFSCMTLLSVAPGTLATSFIQSEQNTDSAKSSSSVEIQTQWLDDELGPTDDKSKAAYVLADVKKVKNGYRLVINFLNGVTYYETGSDSLDLNNATPIGPYKFYFKSGQVNVEGRRDTNGLYQGKTVIYAKDGHKKREITYKDGEFDGLYKTYTSEGKLLTEQMMKNGERHGLKRGYFSNGQVMYESQYKNGKKHGKEERWDPDGSPAAEYYFVDGDRDGLSTNYFDDGSVRKTQEYKERKRVGETKLFYENGELRRHETRNDEGQLMTSRSYDKNGQLKRSRDHVETDKGLVDERKWFNDSGQLTRLSRQAVEGNWRLTERYDEDGNVRDRRELKDYDLDGLYISRSGNGLERVNYIDGKRDGPYTVTDGEGNVTSSGEYDHGKKVGEWVTEGGYGVLKETYNRAGKLTGLRESYDENGNLRFREHYKNGVLDGEYGEYSDGKQVVEGQYVDGKRQGEWEQSFGYAPYKTKQGRYQDGVQVGEWRSYSPEGYLRRIEHFNAEGYLEGVVVSFSEEGALDKISHYKDDRRHGTSWSYSSGKPFAIAVYEKGKRQEKRYKEDFELSEFP